MTEATAPASAANLGPGFDTLALALDLRCKVVAEKSDRWGIDHYGPESPPPEAPDLVLEAARLADTEPLALRVNSEIPIGKGLGSSAAAAIAGFVAARRAAGAEPTADEAFRVAAELDGHPDNAAAASFGGLVAVTVGGSPMRLPTHETLRLVLAVPDQPLSTESARRVLPDYVERPVAVRSLARVVALVEGLRTADRTWLSEALGDELHERPRQSLRPEIDSMIVSALDAGAHFACWSGAGPSVLAFVVEETRAKVAEALLQARAGRVLTSEIAAVGLT